MLRVGDQFLTFEEFDIKLEEYEKCSRNYFWIRDSRTLKTQSRRFPDGMAAQANSRLKYYFLRIACIKGGREHVPKSNVRQKRTHKQGCQAGMFLKLSSTGDCLELRELNEVHNHPPQECALIKDLSVQEWDESTELVQEIEINIPDPVESLMSENIDIEELCYDTCDNSVEISSNENLREPSAATREQKFNMMQDECLKISDLCSQVPLDVFNRRLEFLKTLFARWSNNDDHNNIVHLYSPTQKDNEEHNNVNNCSLVPDHDYCTSLDVSEGTIEDSAATNTGKEVINSDQTSTSSIRGRRRRYGNIVLKQGEIKRKRTLQDHLQFLLPSE